MSSTTVVRTELLERILSLGVLVPYEVREELRAALAPKARHEKHCLLLDPEEPDAYCTCSVREKAHE